MHTHNAVDGFPHAKGESEGTNEIQNVDQNIATMNKYRKERQANGETIEDVNHTIEGLEGVEQANESIQVGEVHNHVTHDHCEIAVEVLNIESTPGPVNFCDESTHYHGAAFQDNGQTNKISTYLLELGIALHSVLIGLTLGTTAESFVPLFIALCFHQFFEAIALGAQIANLKTTSLKSAISMVVFFSLTTPLGIAIGIGIHFGTYNPKSVASLLATGILDSLAAGVLIYVALVNLITAEMGANAHGFYSLRSRLKVLYFLALYSGAGAMAVIGRWA